MVNMVVSLAPVAIVLSCIGEFHHGKNKYQYLINCWISKCR